MPKEKSLDPHIMSQFTGTGHWYRFGIVPNITCTDGAKYVADTAGAYWLLDEIAIAQRRKHAMPLPLSPAMPAVRIFFRPHRIHILPSRYKNSTRVFPYCQVWKCP